MVPQKWHVLPRSVTRRSILLEVHVHLMHTFDLWYNTMLEYHSPLTVTASSASFSKNKGKLWDPVLKHTVRLHVQSSTAPPWLPLDCFLSKITVLPINVSAQAEEGLIREN